MEIFKQGKPFYRGNLHCHTTCSDGALGPKEVVATYRDLGYDFLALTDHRRVTVQKPVRDGDMLVLPGIELDYMWPGEVVHIVGFGMTADVTCAVDMQMGPQGGVDAINACGGRAILAHPHWSLNTLSTLTGLHGLVAAEVYNTVSELRPDSSEILDVAAAHGRLYPFTAADDSHAYEGEQGVSYAMVQADELSAEGIKRAFDAGLFYASQGPRIEQLTLEEGRFTVRCSAASRVYFHSNLVWTPGRAVRGRGLTQASYTLHPEQGERFVRCQVIDEKGRSAWSSPIAL